MNVVLLNPPGKKLYVRNYYCGSTSKSTYIFPPLDLLVLSGILYREHSITVMDCIVDNISEDTAIKKIFDCQADAVVCLVSMVSWDADLQFLRSLKKQIPSLIVIANGDVFFENPQLKMRESGCIDAVLFDFISNDVNNYLGGRDDHIEHMLYRRGDQVAFKKAAPGSKGGAFSIPLPRHELFIKKHYRFPFVRRYPYTAVLTNFGCPFKCSFCIAGKLGFRYRLAGEVIEELLSIDRLGIKELFFEDMTFGVPRANALEICRLMREKGLKFGWACFSRADVLDKELLAAMKAAGCHTIMIGAESSNENILRAYQKGYNTDTIRSAFKLCRAFGIKTVATFILGLPEDTRDTCLNTIEFAKKIDCDYASFNVAVPRPGTDLRHNAVQQGLIKDNEFVFDHSGAQVCMPAVKLSAKEINQLKCRAVREFYLRPGYILKQLFNMRSPRQLGEHIREFFGLLKSSSVIMKRER